MTSHTAPPRRARSAARTPRRAAAAPQRLDPRHLRDPLRRRLQPRAVAARDLARGRRAHARGRASTSSASASSRGRCSSRARASSTSAGSTRCSTCCTAPASPSTSARPPPRRRRGSGRRYPRGAPGHPRGVTLGLRLAGHRLRRAAPEYRAAPRGDRRRSSPSATRTTPRVAHVARAQRVRRSGRRRATDEASRRALPRLAARALRLARRAQRAPGARRSGASATATWDEIDAPRQSADRRRTRRSGSTSQRFSSDALLECFVARARRDPARTRRSRSPRTSWRRAARRSTTGRGRPRSTSSSNDHYLTAVALRRARAASRWTPTSRARSRRASRGCSWSTRRRR